MKRKFVAISILVILVLLSSLCVVFASSTNNDVAAIFVNQANSIQQNNLMDDETKLKRLSEIFFFMKNQDFKITTQDADFSPFLYSSDDTKKNLDYTKKKFNYQKKLWKKQSLSIKWDNLNVEVKKIVVNNGTASVELTENHKYILNNDPSSLLSLSQIDYNISFKKFDNKWLITSIKSNDEFDRVYQDKDIDIDKMLDENTSGKFEPLTKEQLEKIKNNESKTNSSNLKTNLAQYSFNSTRWSDYISWYTENTGDNTTDTYNTLFDKFSPNDCQNFASQCVWYGYGGSNVSSNIQNKLFPMVASGSRQWWQAGPGNGVDSYGRWWNCQNFASYVYDGGSTVQGPAGDILYNNLTYAKVGDTIQLYDGAYWYHTYVVDEVTGTAGSRTNSNIWVSAHTANRYHERLDNIIGSSQINTRNIRILWFYY